MCVNVFKFRKLLAKALLDEGPRSLRPSLLWKARRSHGLSSYENKASTRGGYRGERGHLAGKIGL